MSRKQVALANEFLNTFERGTKQNAVRLLPQVSQLADIRITRDYAVVVNGMEVVVASGSSLVHLAAVHGWIGVVKDLTIKYKCDANCKNSLERTPLYSASATGQLEMVKYLIDEQHCDPLAKECQNSTPLHFVCQPFDSISVVKYLINEQHCDPMIKDAHNLTPLHYACLFGNLCVVQYLIDELNCDPMIRGKLGWTPLHFACFFEEVHVVSYLISTGKVDPHVNNDDGMTPIYYAAYQSNYDLLKLFQCFTQFQRDFPVHTYTKLILTGCSGAGKTTLSKLIFLLANDVGLLSALSSGHVSGVECLTAGIIPLHVKSKVKELGNMVIYDFAGQQEYYSSHAAVLETTRNSAAIFVCIVDLSQCMEKISESIHYWISFIENACFSARESSHVIIVGSHADRVKSSQELKEKCMVIESVAESRVNQLKYGGFVSMDCRKSKAKEARSFQSLISISQQAILSSQPSMSLYCHMLYAFLCKKLVKTSLTLQELTCALALEKEFLIVDNSLTHSLISLTEKGLILFVQNQEHHQSSWVVVEKETLLREVNGTLFAPQNFKQYHQVASNTGIVPITTLRELFPQYRSEMLVGCLESMELCHPVDLSALQDTNLRSNTATPFPPPSGTCHLLFPSLVKEHRPDDLPSSLSSGWCLGCSDPHQFFTNRFLHVLLLRLAFTFPLASKHLPPSSSLRDLERQCKVWQNGIWWKSGSGVSTLVEIVDRNCWVIVLVSEKSREAAQICSSVIKMILNLQQQLCSAVSTSECLISPSLLDRYPFDALPDTDLFDLQSVARAMLLCQTQHKFLLDRKEGMNTYSTDEALSHEPYYLLQPSSVCQLFKQGIASQPVPDPLLQEVVKYCQQPQQKPQDHRELRECVNKYSIFAGRNPIVSSVHAYQA